MSVFFFFFFFRFMVQGKDQTTTSTIKVLLERLKSLVKVVSNMSKTRRNYEMAQNSHESDDKYVSRNN